MMETKKIDPQPTHVVLPDALVDEIGIGELDDFPVPADEYIPYIELLRSP